MATRPTIRRGARVPSAGAASKSIATAPGRPIGVRSRRPAAAVLLTVAALTIAGLAAGVQQASAKVSGPNGEITFFRIISDGQGPSSVYTINPDGSHTQQLLHGAVPVEHPSWSPDGTQIAMECDSCGGSALIVNPDTGTSRVLPNPDPTLSLGCTTWSPDGTRLACEGFNDDDPTRDGVYTVRSSDGGDLTRVTTFDGIPGDYSPDGTQISFVGADSDGNLHIYVVAVNGGPASAITPSGMSLNDEDGGSWSPTGNRILFAARLSPDSRKTIWIVNSDGTGLHPLPIPGCGGLMSDPKSIGCDTPSWSPDGTKIAFARYSNKTHIKHIYTVNPDGSELFEVTHTGLQDYAPDWGTHPLAQ